MKKNVATFGHVYDSIIWLNGTYKLLLKYKNKIYSLLGLNIYLIRKQTGTNRFGKNFRLKFKSRFTDQNMLVSISTSKNMLLRKKSRFYIWICHISTEGSWQCWLVKRLQNWNTSFKNECEFSNLKPFKPSNEKRIKSA